MRCGVPPPRDGLGGVRCGVKCGVRGSAPSRRLLYNTLVVFRWCLGGVRGAGLWTRDAGFRPRATVVYNTLVVRGGV